MKMTPAEYLEHCKEETLATLADNPRQLFGAMALMSAILFLILALPGEKLDGPAFETLRSWHFTDFRLMVVLALHTWGMLRAIFKLKERPELDWWMTVLGFALFAVLAATIDISLKQITLLSGVSFGLAIIAGWLMFTKVRTPAGVKTIVRVHDTELRTT